MRAWHCRVIFSRPCIFLRLSLMNSILRCSPSPALLHPCQLSAFACHLPLSCLTACRHPVYRRILCQYFLRTTCSLSVVTVAVVWVLSRWMCRVVITQGECSRHDRSGSDFCLSCLAGRGYVVRSQVSSFNYMALGDWLDKGRVASCCTLLRGHFLRLIVCASSVSHNSRSLLGAS